MRSILKVALPFGVSTPEAKREPYRAALRAAGLEPVDCATSLDGLAGLCLAGGADVDPALYDQTPHPETEEPDRERDRIECALLREALERDLPVLAICRGLQLLNVAMGGSLRQHIEGHDRRKIPVAHAVAIAPGSRVAEILGPGEYAVNSRHHQCAGRVADRLLVTAAAPDGVIEALEMPGKGFVLAVQWHPEARPRSRDAALFHAFRIAVEAGTV